MYENFKTSEHPLSGTSYENDYLSLFDSLEINNNNDTTPSIVSVDGILTNSIQPGNEVILDLPIENIITLNINLFDIVFFNEENEIIDYDLNSNKIQDYTDLDSTTQAF